MTRVFFVINNLEVGGIQKSLVELLKIIVPRYDVSIYCPNLAGQYVSEIPKSVKIIDGGGFAKVAELSLGELKKESIWYYLLRVVFVQWSRWFGRKIPAYIYSKLIKLPKEQYDWAISYSHPLESHQFAILTNEIVLHAVEARHKATFIHCDYKNYGGNSTYNRNLFCSFDRIAAVSESVRRCFVEVLPELGKKTVVVQNACDFESISRLAKIDSIHYSKTCLVSVSRLSAEKGLSRCLPIIERLRDEGFVFEWHIVGDGPEKNKMKSFVEEHNLKDVVFFEGQQNNPYRFMCHANYLFLPSYHEAAPMVFNEANVLGLGVLATETLSAKELVEERKMGVVCENSVSGIYNMLHDTLKKGVIPPSTIIDKGYNEIVASQFEKMVNV